MDGFSIIGTTDVEYKGDQKMWLLLTMKLVLIKVYNDHFKTTDQRRYRLELFRGVHLCDDESRFAASYPRDYTLDVR